MSLINEKKDFSIISSLIPEGSSVIDIGCNTGVYSRIASESVNTVVALDLDAACIDRLYKNCRNDKIENIFPMVIY